MEVSVARFAISIVFVVIFSLAWRLLNWAWLRPKKLETLLRQQGFSGNPYNFGGDAKLSSAMLIEAKSKPMEHSNCHDIVARVIPFLHHTVQIHGKNSFTWLGPKPKVNITNSEDLKYILTKYEDFPKLVPLYKRLLAGGFATLEGDEWARHRKIINPAFHSEKLKCMLPAIHQSGNNLIKEWDSLVSREGSAEIDVWPSLQCFAEDVISRTGFGSSYEEGKKIFQLIQEQAKLATTAIQKVYIPGWRFIPTKMNKKMVEVDKEIKRLLRGIVSKREEAIKACEPSKDDLLSILMESNFKEIQEHGNNKRFGLSVEEVIEECKLFYFAGQETTAGLLVWTMVLLGQNQSWQTRAREEVLQVFGSNKLPDFDGLNRLKIVTMILREVLRLYPAAVVITRNTSKETQLGKLSLPAGVEITLPILLLHHDKELWGDDASEFKPERFEEGVSKATKGRLSYMPFGGGPRICIGQNFAFVETKTALSMILQRFTFGISPSYTHAPISIASLQPQYGAHLILHRR